MPRGAVGAALLVALAIPAGTAAKTSTTGLRGVVKELKAACPAGDPCDGLARGVVLAFFRNGQRVARTRSHDDGAYRVLLPHGRYSVRLASGSPAIRPSLVRVPDAGFGRVDFVLVSSPAVQ